METLTRTERLAGTLFGTAIGDALGLYVEGLPAQKIAHCFGRVDRFLFPFGIGLLSDDTEQAALVAEALLHYGRDPDLFDTYFRWLLIKRSCSLPPDLGKVVENGAAMRAAIIGVFFANESVTRKTFGVRAARATHASDDAIDGALYIAELAAACTQASVDERVEAVHQAVMSVPSESVHRVIEAAVEFAEVGLTAQEAVRQLGCSADVLDTIALTSFCFIRYGGNPKEALIEIIGCGGDTDTNAAVLGALLGALHGRSALPQEWLRHIVQGPIDLDKLSRALAGGDTEYGGFNYFIALLRNLLVIPYLVGLAICRWVIEQV